MVSCNLASFPIKKECKNLMPHWCSEHQGRRSLGSEPQQSRSPSVTIPAPASAGDDDSGRRHTVISKRDTNRKNAAPHTSFRPQRSGVEKSHSSNDRDVTPPLVISTKAEQSGEISRPYGTVGMAAGDLSALSHNRAEVPLLQYRPLPPLEMTIAAGSIQSFQREKE